MADLYYRCKNGIQYTNAPVIKVSNVRGVANRVILNGSDIGNNGVIGAGNIL